MAADGNAFVAHAPDGRKARGTIDGVAACLQRRESGADVFLRRDIVAIFKAWKCEDGGCCLAEFETEQRRGTDTRSIPAFSAASASSSVTTRSIVS